MVIFYFIHFPLDYKGGAVTHVVEVVNNLCSLGATVHLWCPKSTGLLDQRCVVEEIPIFDYTFKSQFWYQIKLLLSALRKVRKVGPPDWIYSRSAVMQLAPIAISRLLKVPIVIEVNGFAETEGQCRQSKTKECMMRIMQNIQFKASHRVIAVTDQIRSELIRRIGPSQNGNLKVRTIPNGANLEKFRLLDKDLCRRKLGLEPSLRIVTYVGSLKPWHGVETLVRAVSFIKKSVQDVRILIVGGDSDRQAGETLRKLARELRVQEQVVFVGDVEHDVVPLYINASDVCVAPWKYTSHTAFGLTPTKLHEYLACGIPVVASAITGIPEILEHYSCGFTVIPGQPESLADGICRVLALPADEWGEIALRARRTEENHFGWRKAVINTLQHMNTFHPSR